MTDRAPVELHARLEVRDDHVSGEVNRQGQAPMAFSGWIGFLGAVEQACATPGGADRLSGAGRPDAGPPR